MSNVRMQQTVTLLYAHLDIITSEGVHKKAIKKVHDFSTRMTRNREYYNDNTLVSANFDFLEN